MTNPDAQIVTFRRIDRTACQGGTYKAFLKGQGEPCRKAARVNVAGLNLCPVHAGSLLTYGMIPTGVGTQVWETANSKEIKNGPDEVDYGTVG